MHYTGQDMLWLIGSLSRVFRLPFDPQLIHQQFPPPYSRTSLIAALQALDFKVGETVLDEEGIATLERMPFPVVAFLREDEADTHGEAPATETEAAAPHPEGQEAPPPKPATPALLVKADEERVLFFRAGAEQPETVPLAEFTQHFRNDILLVARDTAQTAADLEEEQAASAPQPPAPGHTPFGFRWFVPELMKHKRVWRDILIASLAIQLVGLVTPLFTQVIIDKVIVHQTQSTLVAIAVGLVMFMLFNSAMTWLRQYFVLHTGNRIDAVLGSQVFRHLLHLPLPYFEHRPTGTLVARLHRHPDRRTLRRHHQQTQERNPQTISTPDLPGICPK